VGCVDIPDRRTFLKLLGAGIGGLIIGVAGGSLLRPVEAPPEAVTRTVTVTPTVIQQTSQQTSGTAPTTMSIVAWTQGPERESYYRQENLVEAAKRVTKILRVVGGFWRGQA